MRIGVVGAGIAGVSIASRLAEAGAETTLFEAQSEPPRNATALSGGIVRGYDLDPMVREHASASLYGRDPNLRDSQVSGFHATGVLTIAPHLPAASEWVLDESKQAALLSAPQLRRVGFEVADDEIGVFETLAGVCSPVKLRADLLARAVSAGAKVVRSAVVGAWAGAAGNVALRIPETTVFVDKAVVTTGAWPVERINGLRDPFGARSRSIQTCTVEPKAGMPPLPAFVHYPTGIYGAPIGGNRLLLGLALKSWDVYPTAPTEPELDTDHLALTLARAEGLLPWLRQAEVIEVRRSFDGFADTSASSVEPANIPGIWVVRPFSGSGIRTAQSVARLAITMLLGAMHDNA